MSQRIAFVGAHHDDAELWAGGTLLKADHALVLTADGGGQRNAEGSAAARRLGADHALYQSGTDLFTSLKEWEPTILITHWSDDSHTAHASAALLAAEVATELRVACGLPLRFYECDTYNSQGASRTFEPSHIVDITDVYDLKVEVLRDSYQSQPIEHFVAMVHSMSVIWGRRIACERAEAFVRRPLLGVVCPGGDQL